MTGLEELCEDALPEILRTNLAGDAHLASLCFFFILGIALAECCAKELGKIRSLIGRKERPWLIVAHTLHKLIGDP